MVIVTMETSDSDRSMKGEDVIDESQDLVTPVANVAMTPFSVIGSTCLQVTLSSNASDDKSLAFNMVSASIIATAGMLMAVYLVTARSCCMSIAVTSVESPVQQNAVAMLVRRFLLINPPPITEKERIRVARMMLRCLWFSLAYMTIGLLCRVLKNQIRVSDPVNVSAALVVWILFLWSSLGAPLPKFNVCLRKVGSVFTTVFPLLLMAAYGALFLTQTLK